MSQSHVKPAQIAMIYTGQNLTAVLNGKPYNISADTPGFDTLLTMVREGHDETAIQEYIERDVRNLQKAAKALDGDVEINVNAGVVTYKGQEVRNSLTEKMMEMLEEGFDLAPMSKFLNNLMQNPSMRAVTELYSFLEKGNLPITPDGCFLAYKAVRSDFKDIYSGTLDNSVGKTVAMPRNAVDDNKDHLCSYGLHFCSVDYLQSFAQQDGQVMILKINPRDVVSIPVDYQFTKGRCASYEVIDIYKDFDFNNPTQDLFKSSIYGLSDKGIVPYGTGSSTPSI